MVRIDYTLPFFFPYLAWMMEFPPYHYSAAKVAMVYRFAIDG